MKPLSLNPLDSEYRLGIASQADSPGNSGGFQEAEGWFLTGSGDLFAEQPGSSPSKSTMCVGSFPWKNISQEKAREERSDHSDQSRLSQ